MSQLTVKWKASVSVSVNSTLLAGIFKASGSADLSSPIALCSRTVLSYTHESGVSYLGSNGVPAVNSS